MRPLRAYFSFRDGEGNWTTQAYRDLEPLLDAWSALRSTTSCGAAIHVGFWRPESTDLAEVLERFPGYLLLSDAAVHALPGTVERSAVHVAVIAGLQYWLVLGGFGYEIPDPTAAASVGDGVESKDEAVGQGATAQAELSVGEGLPLPRGWVENLAKLDGDLAAVSRHFGIWDEVSYQRAEAKLQFDSRQRLGIARFLLMSGAEPKADNLLDRLAHCPPWFVAMPLNRLRLTVRQQNVFHAHGLNAVDDLVAGGTNGLLQLPNMGRKSVNELAVALYQALLDGPPRMTRVDSRGDGDEAEAVAAPAFGAPSENAQPKPSAAGSFKEALVSAAQAIGTNARGILAARMGFNCRRMTLQEIADDIGITRERVRQIEAKACKTLMHDGIWLQLEHRLTRLLERRDAPLLLDGLAALDAWFEGVPDLAEPFEFVFERFLERRLSVLAIDGVRYVTRLSWAEWESELNAARRMLEASVADRIAEAEAKSLVGNLLVGRGEELRSEFWVKASEFARFTEGADGTRYLAAYGRSAEAIVHAILDGSPKPLHYADIQRISAAYADEPLEVRRAHAAAANVGILYERGTYGLLKHCPLSESEMAQVCAEVENLALEENSQRQWHCSELCEDLYQRGLSFDGRLTDYVVNLSLKDSGLLVDLGRLVWGLKESWKAGTSSRIDLKQAIASVLERAGRPLTTVEIRRSLAAERGIGDHFQIFPIAPLVRLGEGKWGLVGRDIALGEKDLLGLAHALKQRICEEGRGVHVSEVRQELERARGAKLDERFDAQWLLTVCKDAALRLDKGQYYYPTEWEGSRRLTIGEAVEEALVSLDLERGVTLDEICVRTVELLRRPCTKATISSALQSTQAAFEASSGLWRRASPQAAAYETD